MAYGIVQFVERGERMVTLVRTTDGHPVGPSGLMDPLSTFVEESSPRSSGRDLPGRA